MVLAASLQCGIAPESCCSWSCPPLSLQRAGTGRGEGEEWLGGQSQQCGISASIHPCGDSANPLVPPLIASGISEPVQPRSPVEASKGCEGGKAEPGVGGGICKGADIILLSTGNQSCPLDSVEGFSLSLKKWELLPPMPTGRCSCSSCPAPSLLFVIGGVAQGPSGAVEALCLRDVP